MVRFRCIAGIAAVCWALVAVPALCTGGVLLHPCDCGHAEDCGHEDQCATDPCGVVVTRPNDGSDITLDLQTQDGVSIMSAPFVDPNVLIPIIWSSPPDSPGRVAFPDSLRFTALVI